MKKKLFLILKICFFIACIVSFLYEPVLSRNSSKKFSYLSIEDKTKDWQITFNHSGAMEWIDQHTHSYPQLKKWFKAVSSSVAVADINNDGWADIFFPSASLKNESHLYINHKGQFFEEKAKEYGLDKIKNPVRSAFLDCDNDGSLELFSSTDGCPYLYKMNSHGKYEKLYDFPEGPYCMFTTAINLVDYNKDGLIDIIFGNLTRHQIPNSPVDADNGGFTVLFKNQGQCRFIVDDKTLNHTNTTHINAIGVGDIFNNNNQDIWLATDFNDDWVYKQNGSFYERISPQQKKGLSHNAMSSEWAYLDSPDRPYVFVSHIFEPGYFTGGNQLWTSENNKIVDAAEKLGVARCGWSWGAKFSDLNNDSYLDLIVTNGFISDPNGTSAFYKINTISTMPRVLAPLGQIWSSFENISYAGFQQDCLFINNENKGFIKANLDDSFDTEKLDGRGLAISDFNNDGKMDLVISNQLQPAKLYINNSNVNGNWIGFSLVGTQSNIQAIGSSIQVKLENGRVLRHKIYPLNGYSSQSDARVHFGLGKNKIKEIVIDWINGKTQRVDDYKLNSYNHVIEL